MRKKQKLKVLMMEMWLPWRPLQLKKVSIKRDKCVGWKWMLEGVFVKKFFFRSERAAYLTKIECFTELFPRVSEILCM